mmetsp:Transcript_11359/g.27948  ORF Transcript_11359/g.27948 Transcript_11359/m.27948 type:complete len:322 (-) Transcript_11359:62-1027(-)
MDASSANNNSFLAREQSLRRCFGAIHDDSMPHPTPSSTSSNSRDETGEVCANDQLERGRGSPAMPAGPSSLRPPITPPVSSDDMPPPFPSCNSKKEQRQDTIETSWPARKKHPNPKSSSPITADTAQDMATNLADERSWERVSSKSNKPKKHPRGFRKDYIIGDCARSSSHMIMDPSIQAIGTLQKHDFAFIKRSDGSYTYAILACRSFVHIKEGTETEKCMTFVMHVKGTTKVIRERHWNDFIRRPVSTEEDPHGQAASSAHTSVANVSTTKSMVSESEDLPDMISFEPAEVSDEECSLISSVSDRARALARMMRRYKHP